MWGQSGALFELYIQFSVQMLDENHPEQAE